MITPFIIDYNSEAYGQMVSLRYKVLREPLGLAFSEEDLAQDKNDILLVLDAPPPRRTIACCILTPLDKAIVKLRQMAVDSAARKSGMGTAMLSFAEYVATREGFERIILHARKTAVGFYLKYDYER